MSASKKFTEKISAVLLSQAIHGADRRPTEQQAAVAAAAPEPLLVVAGAGAGKTETIASRVLWLAANDYTTPDHMLGLTFTRKAAHEMGQRMRRQFRVLAGTPIVDKLDPSGKLAHDLSILSPTALTYDAYAGQLLREYGLLVPVESGARVITNAELFGIAYQVVREYRGRLSAGQQVAHVTEMLINLYYELLNGLVEEEEVRAGSYLLIDALEEAANEKKLSKALQHWLNTQELRLEYLGLVQALVKELDERGVTTFAQAMAHVARIASEHPRVVQEQRQRYRVVMLDEYQDTSHAQRVLLRSLFGGGENPLAVMAVGDPMQAIYGWRGATVENLAGFVEDFAIDGRPADKKQLTTSWRNPSQVLDLANAVSDEVFAGAPRPVAPLSACEDAPQGDVTLVQADTPEQEVEYIAERMAQAYSAAAQEGGKFEAAVLIRKNSQALPFAQALARRGVPYEIAEVGGLLTLPEVADLVAIATMLIRPGDNAAALRILAGPYVGLGVADIVALRRRAENLAGTPSTAPESQKDTEEYDTDEYDALENFKQELAQATEATPDHVPGLTDAVADLGERTSFSEVGVQRLEALSARLRHLRTYSLSKSLPDLFADIENLFGIRTEVLVRGDSAGTVHLDRFHQVVNDFPGDGLVEFLDYLQLALTYENGLTAGEVVVRGDRVQILTVHKAKGLEWDIVAVPHADASTYAAKSENYLRRVDKLPDPEFSAGLVEIESYKDLSKAGEAYIKSVGAEAAEENARVFYVAITRTERVLILTSSGKPYQHFEVLAKALPQALITLGGEEEGDAEAATVEEAETGLFPPQHADAAVVEAAAAVHDALQDLPDARSGELFGLWETDVNALIEEHIALGQPIVEVEAPAELTASDLVAIKSDPQNFARRLRRPVPFKPNSYAKRGTAFHQWLEDRFGGEALLDEEQLPGIDDPSLTADELAELKEAFLASEWAERTPVYVEQAFEVSIGTAVVRGRMDAIFRQPDGSWLVVDWKTGRQPQGDARRAAEIQLAVYAYAWRQILAAQGMEETPVRTAFVYVRFGETLSPKSLPTGEELAKLLSQAQGG